MGSAALQDLMRLVTFAVLAVLGLFILAQSLNGNLSFIRVNPPIVVPTTIPGLGEDRVGTNHRESPGLIA